jgi:transposase
METNTYTSKTLDHLGLVAGMCREIGLSELIDELLPDKQDTQIVSTGKALEAMILNGLGFVNKRLYLIPKFFEDKPIELLLGEGLSPEHFNDDRLGRALDELYEVGVTVLFTKISQRVLEVLDYKPAQCHLDTTSMSVHGQYNSTAGGDEAVLHITQGFSKDHRPDLPQVTLQLICDHLSGIPLRMQALDGNSNDSESFREAVRLFAEQLHAEDGVRTLVADSKLYSQATLKVLKNSKLNWVCRVPATLEATQFVLKDVKKEDLEKLNIEGYSSCVYTHDYGEVGQHWVVYHSESAAEREAKTLNRNVEKELEAVRKSLKKLEAQQFHCKKDALEAFDKWTRQWKWHTATKPVVQKVKVYDRKGRPSREDRPSSYFVLQSSLLIPNQHLYEDELFRKSLFIIATNQEIDTLEQQEALLNTYKAQHNVERGFRFIKDPSIVASSFFVQKPERVEALLFVMTSCLLVYAALEHRIRKALKTEKKTVPDQKGKATDNPTARWIFELFVGIHVLFLPDGKYLILNIKNEHRDILSLLSYWNFYS